MSIFSSTYQFGFTKLKVETIHKYFRTTPLSSNGSLVDFSSNSQTWKSYLDLEFRAPLKIADGPIEIGASIARTQLSGGVQSTIQEDSNRGTSWRLFWDPNGKAWISTGIGLGGEYFGRTAVPALPSGSTLTQDYKELGLRRRHRTLNVTSSPERSSAT